MKNFSNASFPPETLAIKKEATDACAVDADEVVIQEMQCHRAGVVVNLFAEGSSISVLDSFAPGFIGSVFRGQNPVFTRKEDMENLLGGLRLAGLSE
jgi:hypothetical protein